MLSTAIQVAALAAFGTYWWWATRADGSSRLVVPRPADVWSEFVTLMTTGSTFDVVRVTAGEFVTAMVISITVGLSVGCVVGSVPYLRALIEPIVAGLYAVPVVMAFPICVLIFGIGSGSKIAFATLTAVFPILIHVIRGVAGVDPGLVRVARSLGAGPFQQLVRVRARAALPTIATGIRISVVLCYLAVVAGEMLNGNQGIGRKIAESMEIFRSARGFAWIAVAVLLAVALGAMAAVPGKVIAHRQREPRTTSAAAGHGPGQ
ncbi:MAG TPA: ABC transporter permease [Ilumatobacter sp.]|nr:ABC transporter permease [Ilumatobacter sp.]